MIREAHVCLENISAEDGLPEKANQDAFLVEFGLDGMPDQHLVSVCDGHGKQGDFCAQFVTGSLKRALTCSPHFNEDPALAFHA